MKKLLQGMAFLICWQNAYASEVKLDLESSIERALKLNEEVYISNFQLEEANANLKSAYSQLFPTIQLEAKAVKTKQDPALFGGGIISENYQQSASISLNQSIYTFGRLSGAIDAAKSQNKLAKDQRKATIADIEYTVKNLFNNAIFYQRHYEISKESYENALANQKALNKRVSFGRVAQGENLKMKADIASRKPSMLEAQRLYENSLFELKNFLNISQEDNLVLIGSLDSEDIYEPKSVKVELSNLVSVSLLENQFKLQKSLEDVESANYLPNLSFFASYGQNAIYADIQEDHFIDQTNTSFGLALTMDFSLGGEKSYARQISRVQTKIKKLQLDRGKRQIEYAIRSLKKQKERLTEKKKFLKEAVALARSSYKVALDSFTSGTLTQTQLNDRELLLTNNKIAYAQNLLQIKLVNSELMKIQITK